MSIDRQWETLELLGLLKKEPTEGSKDVAITSTPTTSPKPPRAPFEAKTFAADPPSSSRNFLGGKYPKGEDYKGEETEGEEEK